jgi:hypothetical protein
VQVTHGYTTLATPKKRRGDPEKTEKKKKHLPSLPYPTKAMVLLPKGHETVVARHEVMYVVKLDGPSFVP